ncbi:MAG: hypothetical protein FJW23_04100 [Acidimicrobiia bacterium]|nr:hypothetical protein [Acidimicrobiia bacterium]
MPTHTIIRTGLGVLVAEAVGCGESPTRPTPLPSVSGNWTDALESSSNSARAVDVSISQAGNSVAGTWVNQSSDWNGTIGGTISGTTFTGTATLR